MNPQRITIPAEDRTFILKEIDHILESGQMAYGKHVSAFEQAFAEFIGVKHAVATGSCTQALEIAVRSLFPHYSRIVMPANTYAATAQAIERSRNRPFMADVDPSNGMMTMESMVEELCPPEGVMMTHIGGNIAPDAENIRDYCRDEHIPLVEDAAHALGSARDGIKAGAIGDVACFSFYPTKVVTVGGEGGMLVTDLDAVDAFARAFRHHGRVKDTRSPQGFSHEMADAGNSCMSEISALIGLTQLQRLPQYIKARGQMAAVYRERFKLVEHGTNWYKCITLDAVPEGIPLQGKVYARPLMEEPAWWHHTRPGASEWSAKHSALPVYNDGTEEDARSILKLLP